MPEATPLRTPPREEDHHHRQTAQCTRDRPELDPQEQLVADDCRRRDEGDETDQPRVHRERVSRQRDERLRHREREDEKAATGREQSDVGTPEVELVAEQQPARRRSRNPSAGDAEHADTDHHEDEPAHTRRGTRRRAPRSRAT